MAAAQEAVKVAKEGTPTKLRAQLRLGRTLFRAGERQAGGGLVQQLLNQHMEDPLALHAYGELALELGQTEDALKVFLRLITQKSEDKAVRALLARSLKAADGVPTLLAQLPPDKSSASAYAFLATVVKEHSGVDAAVALYDHATAPAGVGVVRPQPDAHARAQGRPRRPPPGARRPPHRDDTAARAVGTLAAPSTPPPCRRSRTSSAWRGCRSAAPPPRPPPAPAPPWAATAAARALAELPDDVGGGVEVAGAAAAGRTRRGARAALFFTGVKVLYRLGVLEALRRCSACSSWRAR